MRNLRFPLHFVALAIGLWLLMGLGLPTDALAQNGPPNTLEIHSASNNSSLLAPLNDVFGTPKFCSMNFGTRLNRSQDAQYQSLQSTHFRSGTAAGSMNVIYDDSSRELEWEVVDARIAAAAERIDPDSGQLHYQPVVWHHYNPYGPVGLPNDGWYDNYEQLSNAQRRADLKRYVQATVSRFPEVDLFTLVNHPYRQPIRYPNYINYMLTGQDREEAIAEIFRWANEVNDDADYIVNEAFVVSGESFNADIINQYIQLINNVNSQLAPNEKIDGVGVQGHFGCWSGEIPDPNQIRSQLDTLYQGTGNLPIYVTELDLGTTKCSTNGLTLIANPEAPFDDSLGNVGNGGNTWPSWFDYQGWAYGELMEVFASHPGVKEVTLWDFYDGNSWRKDSGLFFDTQYGEYEYQPKPAFYAVQDYIQQLGCSEGDAQPLPGRIEAESYVAYQDNDSVNRSSGTPYSAPGFTDGVDVAQGESDGYVVGWIREGEWLEYNVNVAQTATYQVSIKLWARNVPTLDLFELYIDDSSTPQATFVLQNAAWLDGFATFVGGTVDLPSGNHTLRLEMIGQGFNLDAVDFTLANTLAASSLQEEVSTSIADSLLDGNNGLNGEDQPMILIPLITGTVR
ncbi:MAG: cellulase family glycosylhydrolase [Chloroflexota bacterium]